MFLFISSRFRLSASRTGNNTHTPGWSIIIILMLFLWHFFSPGSVCVIAEIHTPLHNIISVRNLWYFSLSLSFSITGHYWALLPVIIWGNNNDFPHTNKASTANIIDCHWLVSTLATSKKYNLNISFHYVVCVYSQYTHRKWPLFIHLTTKWTARKEFRNFSAFFRRCRLFFHWNLWFEFRTQLDGEKFFKFRVTIGEGQICVLFGL